MLNKNFVFKNLDDLVNHLYSISPQLTSTKLQTGLYLLYAYYGSIYGEATDRTISYPKRLFDAEFKAYPFGPTIVNVQSKQRSDKYGKNTTNIGLDNIDEDIILFINKLFSQITTTNDISLVDRCHEDIAWQTAYKTEEQIIDNEILIKEYVQEIAKDITHQK